MFDVVGIGAVVLLMLVLGGITCSAWRLRSRWLRWAAVLPLGLTTVVLLIAVGLMLAGVYRLSAVYDNPVSAVKVTATPETVARGEQLAHICAGCHTASGQLPLTGADFAGDDLSIGTLYAPNLTPVHLGDWSDGEIIRAVREGIHREGRSLLFMPSEHFRHLSDADVQAVVAYLRSQPPVEPDTPAPQISAAGAMLANMLPLSAQPPATGPVTAPPGETTPERGQYLMQIIGCAECHGADLRGGEGDFGPPPGPDLTTLTARWSEADFVTAIRTGQRPGGIPFSEGMPWQAISAAAPGEDVRAIYAYLRTLLPTGPAH